MTEGSHEVSEGDPHRRATMTADHDPEPVEAPAIARLIGPAPGAMTPCALAEEAPIARTPIATASRAILIGDLGRKWGDMIDRSDLIGRNKQRA